MSACRAGHQTKPAQGRPEDQVDGSQGHEPKITPDLVRQWTRRYDHTDDVVGTRRPRTS